MEGLLEKVVLTKYDFGTSHWVDITHINNPHSFYVRSTAYRDYESLITQHEEVDDKSNLDVVVYKSKIANEYLRGKILSYATGDPNKCLIFAVDTGFFEGSIPLSDVYKAVCGIKIPPLAIHCRLGNCEPKIGGEWTQEIRNAMKSFVHGESAQMVIEGKTAEYLIVKLYNSCPNDIATMMILTGVATFGGIDSSVNKIYPLSF